MKAPERKPEVVDAISLNKYLNGIVTQIKTKEVSIEQADAISKVADKIIKLNLVRLMYSKHKGQENEIDFFTNEENKILMNKG